MTDVSLAQRQAQIEQLYREQSARLWRSLRAYTGHDHVTDDVVAETFAQLLRRGLEVHDPVAWRWRSAFRIAGGELARRSSHAALTAVPEPKAAAGDVGLRDILDAVGGLSPLQRGAIVLCDYVGYPAAEAAEILGSTPAAMRVHLMRARRHLRSLLRDG